MHYYRQKNDATPISSTCSRCKHEIEDEVHVLFDCAVYDRDRSSVDVLISTNNFVQNTDGVTRILLDNSEETTKQISRYLYYLSK